MAASLSGCPAMNMASPLEQTAGRANILIVDDLPEQVLVLRTVLAELDQNLVVARSGTEALREVLKREFAVILLDVNMPDMDGFETASLIRQYKKSAYTPIIFVTAYADEIQTARGYSLGAVDYIFSPVIPDVLRSKVRVFVDLHNLQQRIKAQADERVMLAHAEAARRAAEENSLRFDFLARASHALSGSLDLGVGMRKLMDLVVPDTARLAVLLLDGVKKSQRIVLVRAGTADGAGRTFDGCDYGSLPSPFTEAMELALIAGSTTALSRQTLRDCETWDAAWPTNLAGGLVLPLHAGDRCFGVLAVATDAAGGYEARDVALLEDLARRAANAFENARLFSDLQQEIVERQRIEEELASANRRKDEFLAMLSHELRNPLAPICNAVEVMRNVGLHDTRLIWARDVIQRQLSHLTTLVEQLLDVARIAQGKVSLADENVDLTAVVTYATETVRPLVEARRHRFEVHLPSEPIGLRGDFARLSQVISNLLNNAAKYTPEGGHIELTASLADGMATVAVRDNGIGIDSSLLPHVFDLFTQGDRALDRSQGGLGVGLTLVREIVELHGGRCEAASDGIDCGSEFRVYLPRAESLRTQSSNEDAGMTVTDPGLRILVVDDNVDAAESLGLFLNLEGYEVRTATDSAQALEYADTFAPDVVLLDIGLPQMNGYEVARRLRSKPTTRDSMLIALTGYGAREDIERTSALGFHHHFVKPIDPYTILKSIASWRAQNKRTVSDSSAAA
jgi:signal transduction histidine kinase